MTKHTVTEDWFDEENDDRLTDEELLADAKAAAEAWKKGLDDA